MKDAAQDVAEDEHRTWRRTWPLGPGWRAPSPPRCRCRRRRLCAARAEMRAQLGSSVAFFSGCGQALPGVPRKAQIEKLLRCLGTRNNCYCCLDPTPLTERGCPGRRPRPSALLRR